MDIQLVSLIILGHLLLLNKCLSPMKVKAQLPLVYNISQIINMFVIFNFHLNYIFSMARPGIYLTRVVNSSIEMFVQ